jgi:hypothetical protein
MNYYQMTTKQLEEEQCSLQAKVRNASPSEYLDELSKLSRVQSLLSYRYRQSLKVYITPAERAMRVQ